VKSAQAFQVHPTDTLTSMTVGSRDSIIYTETKLQAGQSGFVSWLKGPLKFPIQLVLELFPGVKEVAGE